MDTTTIRIIAGVVALLFAVWAYYKQRNTMATQNVREPYQNGPSLRRIGGWLLLFCLGSTITTPLLSIGAVMNGQNVLVITVILAMSAFSVYTGVSLWRVQRNALQVVKTYFIFMLVTALFVLTEPAQVRTYAGAEAVRTLIYVAVWWSYFTKSKRVKATFGRNLGQPINP